MMKTNRLQKTIAALGAAAIVTGAAALTGIFAEPARAQQPPASVEATGNPAQPATATVPVSADSKPVAPPASSVTKAAPAAESYLSLAEIERRLAATGLRVTEIEVQDKVVEVEGRDGSNREIELLVDRRSGEILSRKADD